MNLSLNIKHETSLTEDEHDHDCDCLDCMDMAFCNAYDLMESQIKESLT